MAPLYLLLGLILQGSFVFADIEDLDEIDHEITSQKVLMHTPDYEPLKNLKDINKDWMDMFLLPTDSFHSSPSASMMAQVAQSDKPLEEQLEDIKNLAEQITLAIQSEMANLLSYALRDCDKNEHDDNTLRKKRSIESPMDSTQMVMRLLRHIKSNNEYQNIAIEKMMSAQEIADKFGIAFNPDPEILTDLAIAANEQAKEMTAILNDALEMANITQEHVQFVPIEQTTVGDNSTVINDQSKENDTYYTYFINIPEELNAHQNTPPHHEHAPDVIGNLPYNNYHYDAHDFHYYPETQIAPPPVHQHINPVSPMPNFYEPMTFFPSQDHYSWYSSMEPITTTTTIVLPFETAFEPEPELVGEEFEETVTSKVFIDYEESGASTVNHVMTHTISEKSHFKTPQIENLPQQMQYYFFVV